MHWQTSCQWHPADHTITHDDDAEPLRVGYPGLKPSASLCALMQAYNPPMNAAILSIGDELVLGQTVDTNSAYLAARLCRYGLFPTYHHTVADDQNAIAAAITLAAQQVELVLITGGLGPTQDDLTRQGLAQAMGVELVLNANALTTITAFFQARGRSMSASNRMQAMCPRGATMLENTCGTAPGIHARLHKADLFIMPGVPREMFAMFDRNIVPFLQNALPADQRRVILTTKINTFGLGESVVGEMLGQLMARDRNPKVGTTVTGGIVSVRLRSEFDDAATAQRQLDDTITQVQAALHPFAYSRDEVTLPQVVVPLLVDRQIKLVTAESCTGGMLGQMITDVPGSSAVYQGGWVTYANDMKVRELGVPESTIKQHGAVSEPVAVAMAQGALQQSTADIALSVTGIAGPDGGSDDKPVGTVYMALAARTHESQPDVTNIMVRPQRFQLMGDRSVVRDRACKSILQTLRFHLLGLPLEGISWAVPATTTAK